MKVENLPIAENGSSSIVAVTGHIAVEVNVVMTAQIVNLSYSVAVKCLIRLLHQFYAACASLTGKERRVMEVQFYTIRKV